MSDEYIYAMILEELRETCPGPKGCHGFQSWCPVCGDVGHVCNDPRCDTHRRDTDVQANIRVIERSMRACAQACRRIERLMQARPKTGPAVASPRPKPWEPPSLEQELGWKVREYEDLEKDVRELEGELMEIQGAGADLVPRGEGAKTVPKDR
jgi:hypothetical protein